MSSIRLKTNLFIHHPIVKIILSTIGILLSVVLVKVFFTKPILGLFTESEVVIKTVVAAIGSGVMILAYYFLNRYYERVSFRDFSMTHFGKDFFGGFFLGFAMVSFTVLMLFLLGHYQLIERGSFVSFLPTLVFIFGAAVLEEIIFRGLLYRILEKWKGRTLALIISPLVFQLPHFMNPHEGVIPAIMGAVFGLVICLMYIHTRTLWLPIAFHFGWNLVQPVFGTTLSGIESFTNLYVSSLEGPAFLTGGLFGLETSVFSMTTLILLGLFYFKKMKKQSAS